jgi:hypothetical protein
MYPGGGESALANPHVSGCAPTAGSFGLVSHTNFRGLDHWISYATTF